LTPFWWAIAEDNCDAAERVEAEIIAACLRLARHPRMGTKRKEVTKLQVRFWSITQFPNYVIVYRPDTAPLQVVAVLPAKRDLKEVLGNRSK
jgi:plasmid stabilization system protein ParE